MKLTAPLLLALSFSICNSAVAQSAPLVISREAVAARPFTVVGPRGALLGQQDGKYEAWIFPWKIFSGMRITARMDGYDVPINVNDHAAWVDVQPDRTTITYSHANFTVRQTMMAPKAAPDGTGVLVWYEVEAVRPITLTFSFDPVMQRMWPASSDGPPDPEWIANPGGAGFFILHQSLPGHVAAVAMPSATSGILQPYQERARYWPLQFVLRVDPEKSRGKTFPLLMTLADTPDASRKEQLAKKVDELQAQAQAVAQASTAYYRDFAAQHTRIETPDASLNDAFAWAEVAIDQLRVQTTPHHDEEAFTAGFVGSGDSARPGFGWFFGRDGLWTLYAVNSYGDYTATRQELDFLLHRQRANGQIMHEWSQTADLVDWQSLPYEYAAADATPLLPMAVNDYLKISGDTAYVRAHWSQLALAWHYETTHDSADGLYNNGSGTGWVESWIPAMPQQELYLAALDEQASVAFANLARATGHADEAQQASARAAKLRGVIEGEYYLPATGFYAFSHNADGSTDNTATVFPAVAWWDGSFALQHEDRMFPRLASSEFSTDWGARLLSDQTPFYDPISYHQGSVWPLFTGWLSVAEYRTGHPLAGYAHLMQNANLTWAQDLGSTTELLSGRFFQVLGRSTSHQLWSSAMVISPVLRGMFGLEWDVANNMLTVTPQLPADWNSAAIRALPFGDRKIALAFSRSGQELLVKPEGDVPPGFTLRSRASGATVRGGALHIPLPAVEVAVKQALPPFGMETQQMKVLDVSTQGRSLTLSLSAQAGSVQTLTLRENRPGLRLQCDEARIDSVANGLPTLTVSFPAGSGYVNRSVHIHW